MTKTVTVESITPMSSPLNIIKDANGNSNGTNTISNTSDVKDKNNQILSPQAFNNSIYNDVLSMNIFNSDSASLSNDSQFLNLNFFAMGANGSDPTLANLNTNSMESILPLYGNLNEISSLNMEDTFSANTNNFITTTDTISAQPTDNQNSANTINTSSANELNSLESGKTDHLDFSQFIENDFLYDQSSVNVSTTNAMSTSTAVTAAAATATTATTSAAAVISTTTAQTTNTNANLTKSNSLNNINTTNTNTTTTTTTVNPTSTNPTTTTTINTTTTTTTHPTSINNFIPSNVSLIGNQTSRSITSTSAAVAGVASVATVPSTSLSSTNELSNISNKSNTTATTTDIKINNNTIIPGKSNKSETSKSTSLSSSIHNIEGGYHGISNISPFTKTGVVNPSGVSTSTIPSTISSSMPMVTDSHTSTITSTQKSKTTIGSVSSSVSSVVATTPKANVIKSTTTTTANATTTTIASTTNTTNIMNTTNTNTTPNTTINNTNTNTITNTNKPINNSSIQGNVLSSVTSSGSIGSTVTLTHTPRNAATSTVHIQRNMSQGPYVNSQVPMASPVQVQMLSHPPTPVQSMGVSMAQPPTPSQTMRYSPMMASQTRTAIPVVQGQGQALRGPGPLPNGTVIQQPHGQQRFVVANGQPHPQTQPLGQPIAQQVQQIQQVQVPQIPQVPQVQQVQQIPQTIPQQHQTNFIPQQQNVGIPTASPAPSTGQIQVQRVQTPAQTPGQLPGQLPSQVSGQVQVQGQIPGQQIVQQQGTPYILNGKPQPQPQQPQSQTQTQTQTQPQTQPQPQTQQSQSQSHQPQTQQPQQPQQTAFVVANNSNANGNPGTIVNAVPHQTPTQPAQRVVNGTVQQIPIQQVLPSPGTQPNPQQNIQAQVGTPQGQAIALGQGQGQGQAQGQGRGQAITTIQGSITAMPTPPQQSSVYASNVNGTPNLQSTQSIKQATPNLPVQGQIPNQAMFSPMSQQQNKITKVISNPVAQPQQQSIQQINVAAQQAQQQKPMMANVPGAAVHTMISPVQKNGTFATTAIQGIPVQTANGQRIVVQQAPGQPPSQPIIIQQQPQAAIQAFRMPGQQVILNQPQAHPVQGQPQPVIIQQQPTQQVQMIPQQVQVIQHPPAGAIPIQNIPMSTIQQQPQLQQPQQIQRIAYPANVAQPMQMAQVQQPQQIQFQQGQPQVVQQIGPNGQIIQITRNPTFIQQPGPGMPQQPQAVRMVQIPGQPGQPPAYQVQPSQVLISNPGQQQAQVQAIPGMNPMAVVQPQTIALVNGQPQPGTPSNDKIMKGMNPAQQRSPFVQLSNISKSLKGAKGSPYMNAKYTSATSAAMNAITFRKESPSIKTGVTAASPLVNRPI